MLFQYRLGRNCVRPTYTPTRIGRSLARGSCPLARAKRGLVYNLGNFLRQAVLPQAEPHSTLTTLREKLIKIGAKVVRHSRQVIFQMAEVAIPRELFRTILERIGWLRLPMPLPG